MPAAAPYPIKVGPNCQKSAPPAAAKSRRNNGKGARLKKRATPKS